MGKRKITNSIKNNKLNQTNASWICRCGVHSHYHYISNSWQEQNFSISHHLTTRNIYYYLAFCLMGHFLFGCYAWLCDATCPIRQDWQHAGHRMKQSNDKIRKLKRKKKSSQNCDLSCYYSCPIFRWIVVDIYIARCVAYHVMHVYWIPTASSNAIFVLKWLCVTQIWENDYAAPTKTCTLHIQSRCLSRCRYFSFILRYTRTSIFTLLNIDSKSGESGKTRSEEEKKNQIGGT